MSKVLVTGADGFIGSHLVEYLLEEGHELRAFVFYNSFNSNGWLDSLSQDKLSKIEIFAGDIRDPNGVRTAMEGIDLVYHLAALIAIPYSYHSPDSYVDTNIKGTLNVLQAARLLKTKRVLVTSTSEVYGTAQYVPINEEHPNNVERADHWGNKYKQHRSRGVFQAFVGDPRKTPLRGISLKPGFAGRDQCRRQRSVPWQDSR